MEVIEHLLAHGADLCIRDSSGTTALIAALLNGRSRALKLLLQHSDTTSSETLTAPLSLQSLAVKTSGTTALHLAAFSGDLALVQELVHNNAIDIDAPDDDGATPV